MRNLFSKAVFVFLFTATQAIAAILPQDSLLCEGDQQLAVLKKAGINNLGGEAQLKEASLHLQFNELRGKNAKVLSDLAVSEELIRGNRFGGSSSARAVDAKSGLDSANAEADNLRTVINTCAASGPEQLPVEIIKQLPISGATQVRVKFKGAIADLWTNSRIISNP
ncbi:hypothetical protein [Paracidovorax citrulli]|uniref:hypothetical protein n=1 Tax=Paracidovorax citrulli TaxID=80869 RepID=UPI00126A307E|nr:hypothetical protein [Paracidovorax citrulli]